jgi:Plavaka transposase
MDFGGLPLTPAPFRCTCTRHFTQESAYTKHQCLCTQGKKRLFSALSKAKELLGSAKRSRVDGSGRPYACLSTASSSVQPPRSCDLSPSANQVNEGSVAGPSNTGSTLSEMHSQRELSCAAFSSLNTDSGAAPMVIDDDEDLSLAQRRSRRVDVPMPLRYRQYEDVLPQPPPSVPLSHTAPPPGPNPPENPTHASTGTPTSLRGPPFRTAKNAFGLVRQFFSSIPPSHDPEEAVTLQDMSSVPAVAPAEPDTPCAPHDLAFHPYPNQSSFELGHWYWNGGVQKSHKDFKELIDIVGDSHFDPDDVRSTPWDRINSTLGTSRDDDEENEWEDEDAGWRKTEVTIQVPFSRTTAQPGSRSYMAADLYHRPLISVIREKLSNVQDDELFHYEPYELRWNASHLPREVHIHGELYASPAYMHTHRELQESPGEPGCDLPRVVVALMFWSDATHLTTFGNARLWPVYMYFGNESKYRCCKPSCHLGNHVAYFQKVRSPLL